jgi:hypothetical protein
MDTKEKQEPVATPRKWDRDAFKAPPVVSRRFLIRLDISKEDFEQHASHLMDLMQKEGNFDHRGIKAQWNFRLEIQGKAPKPKVLLTHIPVLMRSPIGNIPRTVVELYPPIEGNTAQLLIEQERTDEATSRFEDLEREIRSCLPRVLEHFRIIRVGGFALEYRNLIQRERYPIFWEGENLLMLGRLLWLFQNNAGPANFVTPFSVEFNTGGSEPGLGNVRFHMETVPTSREEFALEVILAYNSLIQKEKHGCDVLFKELDEAHGLLFENFVRQFAPDALEAFTR